METKDKIRAMRTKKGISQNTMAELVGISHKTYSNIEAGKSRIDIELLDKLSEHLEVGIDELISGEKILAKSIKISQTVSVMWKPLTYCPTN